MRILGRWWLAAGLALAPALGMAQPTDAEALEAYRRLRAQVDGNRIAQTYREFSALGSRLTGSPGEAAAMDKAERALRELGLEVVREPFTATVPDPQAVVTLTTESGSISVWPLWPNLVRTSTCDVRGPIVYGGTGSLEELDGKRIEGSVVLLEFGGGSNWKNAAMLGAAALVFIEPEATTRAEAERKFLNVPIRTPRFWLPIRHAGPALSAARRGESVRLKCRQDWLAKPTANLIAEIPGSDPVLGKERIVLFAYLDSMSVVPGLAPGAEGLGGLALLLEMARLMTAERPLRTVELVVSSGHGLALQGAREYLYRRLQTDRREQLLTVTLDISSGSRSIGSYAQGYFYDYRWEAMDPVRNISRTLRQHADHLIKVDEVAHPRLILTDAVNNSDNRTWKNNTPGRFAYDCEPFTMAGYNALTFATIEDGRDRVDTPLDTLDKVNLANVVRQAQTLRVMLWHLTTDTTEARGDSRFRVALRSLRPSAMSLTGGFATIEGRVVRFDPNQSFIPDIPVPDSIAVKIGKLASYMGVRGNFTNLAEGEHAEYRLTGLVPINAYPTWLRDRIEITAFHMDRETGEIDHSIQRGIFAGEYDTWFRLKTAYKSTPLVLVPARGVDLFELVDPRRMVAQVFPNVMDAKDDGPPQNFGFFKAWKQDLLSSDVEDTAVLYAPPDLRWKLIMGSDYSPTLMLLNATPDDPDGYGYMGAGAEPSDRPGRANIAIGGTFPNTPLQAARDLVQLNQARIEKFARYRIISPGVDALQAQAREETALAEAAEGDLQWSAARRHARAAWGLALRAHPVLQKTAADVVNGVLFYLFLLIPFSYFLERLVFGSRTLIRQLLTSIAIFLVSFLILRFIHPAFEIVENPFMIFVAFIMGVLSLIVIAFILGKFENSLRTIRQIESGVHEVDIGRTSVAIAAFNLGVGNMTRRKARTFLTTATLVVMTFIVLSFTSLVPELAFNEVATETEGRYAGMLVRNPGLEPLESSVHRLLANEFMGEGTVARRLWYYGADIGDQGNLTVSRSDRSFEARALVGLDPQEAQAARPQEALLPGGRWFKPGEDDAMILPQPVANQLKIAPEDVGRAFVRFAGVSYRVIGIFDTGLLQGTRDLDGEPFLPADFNLSRQLQTESQSGTQDFREFVRLDPAQCVFTSANRALSLGADIRSVAVAFEEPTQTREALKRLMPRLTLNLYASVPKERGEGLEVKRFSAFHKTKGSGLGSVLVPMLIATVFVFNTMVASVFERRREISIFSSIGLAPNHIGMLFFAESLVYGVLGSVFGYFGAQCLAKAIIATGTFQGLYLNFSSTSAVLSAAVVMSVVLLSTIYPARVAARIAAPALDERMWDTEPEGDDWSLQLPFSITQSEVRPLVEFLGEWFKGYEEYTIGSFVTSDTSFFCEAGPFGEVLGIRTTAWLAPYDLGVSQILTLRAEPTLVEGVVELKLHIVRLSGESENWVNVNRRFLRDIRKQFLTWRTLDASQRTGYAERAERTFGAYAVSS